MQDSPLKGLDFFARWRRSHLLRYFTSKSGFVVILNSFFSRLIHS